MPGLVIDGEEVLIPGVDIVNFLDIPKYALKYPEDCRFRNTRRIRSIIIHNTKNIETKIKPGVGPDTDLGTRISRLWSTDDRHGGAQLSVDWCGTVFCHCDLLKMAAYHAGVMNEVSIGIELYEDWEGIVYEHQLNVCVAVVDFLTAYFGIQRQIHLDRDVLDRCLRGGKDLVGVFGHCNVKKSKRHDPGNSIFEYLATNGYFVFDFNKNTDITEWKYRQSSILQIPWDDCDGIPGPITIEGLIKAGYKDGLWMPAEKE